MYKNIRNLYKIRDFRGSICKDCLGHGRIRRNHVEIEFGKNSKAKHLHAYQIKLYPTLRGWPTCACSYKTFLSDLGGIPGKSSEIPPRWAGSLLIWPRHIFIGVFLKKARSHLSEPAHVTWPAHPHKNSPLMFQ